LTVISLTFSRLIRDKRTRVSRAQQRATYGANNSLSGFQRMVMPGAREIANFPGNNDGSQMIHAFPRESIIAGNRRLAFTICVLRPRRVDT